MPTDTAEDWAVIATRLSKVPTALEQYVESLHRRRGPGQRQPAPPGRGVHRPVRGVHRRRRLLRHAPRRRRAAGAPSWTPHVATALGRGRRRPRPDAYAELGPTLRREILDRRRPSPTPAAASATSWSRAPSSAPPSTSRRPTPGGRTSWPASPPRWRPSPSRSSPAPRSRRHRRCSTPTRPTSCTAPTRCRRGCRSKADEAIAEPGRHALRHPRAGPHDRVPDRADADRRHLLHRPERGLQPARAACGGRCPRASPSSAPGAS